MSNDEKDAKTKKAVAPADGKSETAAREEPEWAQGLKRLYDSVVDEPLPDTFTQLLSKLDETDRK